MGGAEQNKVVKPMEMGHSALCQKWSLHCPRNHREARVAGRERALMGMWRERSECKSEQKE